MNNKYDYLIVGSGLFGATFAYEAMQHGKTCLVIDKRHYIGGNVYTENIDRINIHAYGAHIFHTSNKDTWNFVNQFAEFNNYINSPLANYHGELFNLPFNMNTFHQMWGINGPNEAREYILANTPSLKHAPQNLEEQAIHMVGKDIYKKLVKGYTEKQWGTECKNLPPWIIKRLPLRFTYNNNYFNDRYQGIPIGGYTQIIEKMLKGADIRLNYDFFEHREELKDIADTIVYTGKIDQYFDYCYGELEWRSLKFEIKQYNMSTWQGNAVINYTDSANFVPFTRSIEHKLFECLTDDEINKLPYTYVTYEYPMSYNSSREPYYPINNEKNNSLYEKYKELSLKEPNVIFGGRLGEYKYYDMAPTIEKARSYWK